LLEDRGDILPHPTKETCHEDEVVADGRGWAGGAAAGDERH